jgi:hypothetical protein
MMKQGGVVERPSTTPPAVGSENQMTNGLYSAGRINSCWAGIETNLQFFAAISMLILSGRAVNIPGFHVQKIFIVSDTNRQFQINSVNSADCTGRNWFFEVRNKVNVQPET